MVLFGIGILFCGLAIGFIAGLAGVGGGAIVTPLLRLGYGLDILTSTATSLFTILPTSLSGSIRHVRNGYTNVKVAVIIGAVGAVASVPGSFLAQRTPSGVLTVITAISIILPAATIIWSMARQKRTHENRPIPQRTWATTHLRAWELVVCVISGMFCGVLSGMVGIGGGAGLLTPILLVVLNMEMHEMAGTSSLVICLSGIPAVFVHAFAGDINWLFAILIAAGTVPGAQLGAKLTPKVSSMALKLIFAGVLVACGIAMVVNMQG